MSGNIMLMIFLILLAIYLRLKYGHQYWKRRNVPCSTKTNVIFGDFVHVLFQKESIVDLYNRAYNEMRGCKYIGGFVYQKPVLSVMDPELIKLILCSNFSNFQNRGVNLYAENEPLTHHLAALNGEPWKLLRKKLTIPFSLGKMKLMFPFVKECSDELNNVLKELAIKNEMVEAKDLMERYTTDVIASCSFGIKTNSMRIKESLFKKMGCEIFKPRFSLFFRYFLQEVSPFLSNFLGLRFFTKNVTEFFEKNISETVSYRESNNYVRGDFLDSLIKMKNDDIKNRNNVLSSEESSNSMEMTLPMITAQCILFFAAGFETSSSTTSFCLLELARNPQIQRKAQEEIEQVLKHYDGTLNSESLKCLHYLDMVIFETLRMYPSVYMINRKCTKPFVIPNTDIVIEKDIDIVIPVYTIHRDPQYYKDPETFKPENFTKENIAARPQFSYLPFGEGPRNCIGSMFGMMQVKLAIATILSNYNIHLSDKTQYPLKFKSLSFVLSSAQDIWVTFSKRDKSKVI